MQPTYLSDIQLAARYCVHRSTIWRWVKSEPGFPQPIALSPGGSRWKLSEILQWEQVRQTAG